MAGNNGSFGKWRPLGAINPNPPRSHQITSKIVETDDFARATRFVPPAIPYLLLEDGSNILLEDSTEYTITLENQP